MSLVRQAFLIPWVLSLAAGVASAQQAGMIVGRVTDQTGAPLPGVTIELTTLDGDRATVSDNSGVFRLDRIPTGSAELTFRLINFAYSGERLMCATAGRQRPMSSSGSR